MKRINKFFRTLIDIITAGFLRPIAFRDVFLADQLLSIVIVLNDLQFTLCFFLSADAWTGSGFFFFKREHLNNF